MANFTVQTIVDLLSSARREKRMTQQKLAALLDVPQSYVAKVESGRIDIRTSTLIEITRLLDLELVFVPRSQLTVVRAAMAGEMEMIQQRPLVAYRPDEDAD